ncbi:MAG: HAD-IB family hydrolase [Burkholderiaceae bacterium]
MRLALFDLDHTLLPIDSADTWSHFLVARAGLDAADYGSRIREYARTYKAGCFDVEGYLAFQMGLLARFPRVQLEAWRAEFFSRYVEPALRPEAFDLVESHRAAGDTLALVTGTHAFVTRPIATRLGIEHLLAVRPAEDENGEFTGRYIGTHTYLEGKVRAVEQFLAERGASFAELESSVFYSDSINDLPLLERVAAAGGRAVATHPDPKLAAVAAERGWDVLQLFDLVTAHG